MRSLSFTGQMYCGLQMRIHTPMPTLAILPEMTAAMLKVMPLASCASDGARKRADHSNKQRPLACTSKSSKRDSRSNIKPMNSSIHLVCIHLHMRSLFTLHPPASCKHLVAGLQPAHTAVTKILNMPLVLVSGVGPGVHNRDFQQLQRMQLLEQARALLGQGQATRQCFTATLLICVTSMHGGSYATTL